MNGISGTSGASQWHGSCSSRCEFGSYCESIVWEQQQLLRIWAAMVDRFNGWTIHQPLTRVAQRFNSWGGAPAAVTVDDGPF